MDGPARFVESVLGFLAVLAVLATASCRGDHHVSPWGAYGGPSLAPFVGPPDLAAQLARIDVETAGLGLVKSAEIPFDLPPDKRGGAAVIRAYEGRDAAGRAVHAVRVATPRGVVLAEGPLDAGDLDRSLPTELVVQVAVTEPGGGAAAVVLAPGSDLNGDGSPDIVLRNSAGVLAIWRISGFGSGVYDVAIEAPPTQIVHLRDAGSPALWGERVVAAVDPIAPKLTDVATFDGKVYADTTPEARAWHAREASMRPAGNATDAVRLRVALERAWHQLLSGGAREAALAELAKERVPPRLAPVFEAHRARVASLSGR